MLVATNPSFAFGFTAPPVARSFELERILALPRRTPPDLLPPETVNGVVEEMTTLLRTPEGTQTLWPQQAFALSDAVAPGGLMGALPVGAGKTLVSLLLPVVLGAHRTLLLVPAALRDQLLHRSYPAAGKNWRVPVLRTEGEAADKSVGGLWVFTYNDVSRGGVGPSIFDLVDPDLVVGDEGHQLFGLSSSRRRRYEFYFARARAEGRRVRYAHLSGTILKKSYLDLRLPSAYALDAGSPAPRSYGTAEEWAFALDTDTAGQDPGALALFASDGEDPADAVSRRLIETPGFVAFNADPKLIPASHVIYRHEVTVPKSYRATLAQYRATWTRPDGEPIDDVLHYHRHLRELACGFYNRWVWPDGVVDTEWLEARRAYDAEVRRFLLYSARPGLDSEGLLDEAAESGEWSSQTYAAWARVKDRPQPPTEAVWIDDFLVRSAAKWAEKPGVVWTEHRAFGVALAALTGLPYHHGGSAASAALFAEDGSRSVILSLDSYGTGRDELQFHFSRQLFTAPSPSGYLQEQYLGRLHRPGVRFDEVSTHVCLHIPELVRAFEQAREEAAYIERTLRTRQKLTSMSSYAFEV